MWRLLQLCDSAFPAGGFAHSGGLEAAVVFDGTAADALAEAALWQAGTFALPFVREAYLAADSDDRADRLAELESLFQVSLANHVARRASRSQGRALARACCKIFTIDLDPAEHLPVVSGHAARLVGLSASEAMTWFLFMTARGVLSAAVRLGRLQPTEAQQIHDRLPMAEVLAVCAERPLELASHSAPILEIVSTLHDQLQARLFQS